MSDKESLQSAQQALNLALLAADSVVYLISKWIASRLIGPNRKSIWTPRVLGSIAVIVFSSTTAWLLLHFYLDKELLASLPPTLQGQYVGNIIGIPVFPALAVLAVVAIRAWLEKRRQPPKSFLE
jgi:hypothetical protein